MGPILGHSNTLFKIQRELHRMYHETNLFDYIHVIAEWGDMPCTPAKPP